MNIQKISVDKLNPAEYNPRKDLKPGFKSFRGLYFAAFNFSAGIFCISINANPPLS